MKNKKNIIVLSLIITIILLITIFAVLYFSTDIFKTNQQLFYKYLGKIKIIDTNVIEQYNIANNIMKEKNNSSNMQIKVFSSKENNETQISDIQEIFTVNSNGLRNVLLKQAYRDYNFSKDNQTFLTLKCLKDNNTYGIIADNILSKYLSIDNTNLKEVLLRIGLTDTSLLPNSIPNEYEEVIKINEETYKEIKDNYFALINESINKDNFYKIKKEDKSQIFGVSFSEQEVINVVNILLDNAKNDERLLNLISDKLQLLNYDDITVEKLQTYIQEYIQQLNNNTYSDEKDYLKISLIVQKDQIISVEIEQNYNDNNNKINDKGKVIRKRNFKLDLSKICNMNLVIKEDETEIFNITTEWLYDNEKINISFDMKNFENHEMDMVKFIYQIRDFETDNIKQNCNINIVSDTEQYQISIETTTTLKEDVQISKLTTENSVKVNTMTKEEINLLINALINRINELYQIDLKNIFDEYITIH